MSVLFDDIKFEVETSDGWIDITSDVMINPAPKWNRGIMGNSLLDRVGSPGYLSFSLDNSQYNANTTLGYYSPGSTDAMGGWTTGLPVRLSFGYEGLTFYKFYGRIKPDGLKVYPGIKEERRVDVVVGDYMAQANMHQLKLLTLSTNQRIDEVMPLIINNMPISPLSTNYETGASTFPSVFDTITSNTTAVAEWQKLSNSELGAVYVIGDDLTGEVLRSEGQNTRLAITAPQEVSKSSSDCGFLLLDTTDNTDRLLLDTTDNTDKLILNESQAASFTDNELYPGTEMSYGKEIINRVEVKTYPRRIDAAATTVLFTLQSEFTLGASETKTGYFGRYRDPSGGATYVNGMDMVAPTTDDFYVETSDGANATTDVTLTTTYGTEGVSYDLVNNVAASRIVKTLMARGKGIYIYDAVTIVYEDLASQLKNGVRSVTVDMKYQDDPTVGELFADILLTRYKDPDIAVEKAVVFANRNPMTMFCFLQLEPGTRMTLSETVTGINRDFFIQGYEAEITNGLHVWWKPVLQWSGLTSTT